VKFGVNPDGYLLTTAACVLQVLMAEGPDGAAGSSSGASFQTMSATEALRHGENAIYAAEAAAFAGAAGGDAAAAAADAAADHVSGFVKVPLLAVSLQ
jgi:hypothetical protein